jgi:hypothetical protein
MRREGGRKRRWVEEEREKDGRRKRTGERGLLVHGV